MTRLLEKGQPFAVVAEIMGWSTGTAMRMMKRYAHIGPSARRDAMAALDIKAKKRARQRGKRTLIAAPATVQ